MDSKCFILFFIIFFATFTYNHACSMDSVSNWLLPISLSIQDTHEGVFFRRSTSNIIAIDGVTFGEGLNAGPYIDVSLSESFEFTLVTNEAYRNYEERETVASMGVTVLFRCSSGSPQALVFQIDVIDTNNNAPQFQPNSSYHFKIAPPVPPSFLITDCISGIIVRDIDLTTEMIVFDIEENAYFEIAYDGSTTPKEFKAALRTKTFIRRLQEPITLWISATDVDRTNDPSLTTNGTIQIEADTEFEFPDEPIFSESFYLATYSDDDQVLLQELIFLEQGYDQQVVFSLEGDYKNNFELVTNGNSIDLNVTNPLPAEIWTQSQIYLIIRARREHTSGATATIIVNFEEIQIPQIEFRERYYTGSIDNAIVDLEPISLIGGSAIDITYTLTGALSDFFIQDVDGGVIILSLDSNMPNDILIENNVIVLELKASATDVIPSYTTIILEVIKENEEPPEILKFNQTYYTGTYREAEGLVFETIIALESGYDENVEFTLIGDESMWFKLENAENGLRLALSEQPIPTEILFGNRQFVFTVNADKAGSISASSTIVISLPDEISFDELYYTGVWRSEDMSHERIFVSGYNGTSIEIFGQYGSSFTAEINEGNVIVELRETSVLPIDTTHVVLELSVPGASCILILDVIDPDISDNINVFFDELYYTGIWRSEEMSHERISVTGYNGTSIEITGQYGDSFTAQINEGNVIVALRDTSVLPIDTNHVVLELRVPGASCVLILDVIDPDISDNTNVYFDELYYTGIWRSEDMTHERILVSGYNGTSIEIHGQYGDSFTAQIIEGSVIVELRDTSVLPIDTTHVVLELRVPGASCVLILDVIDPDISDNPNVFFDELFYAGVWRSEDMTHERIFVSGYNGTTIEIHGQYGDSFTAQINEGNVIVELRDTSVLPIDRTHVVLELRVPGASCVLILDVIDPDISDNPNVFFDELYYTGVWRSEDMSHERIFVSGYNGTAIEINGQYGDSFIAQINEGIVILELRETSVLPIDRTHVVLELRVPGASCVLILDVIDPDISDNPNVFFNELYYTGIWRSEDMSHERIFVSGYNGTTIEINGQYGDSFTAQINDGNVIVELRDTSVLPIDRTHVVLELRVPGASCVLILDVIDQDISDNPNVFFDELYYTGVWRSEDMSHERIFVSGYNGTTIEVNGQYGDSFIAQINEGIVILELRDTSVLPIDRTHVVLELRVPGASSVLILDVIDPDISDNPNVFFSELYYTGIWRSVDMSHERIFVSGYNGTTIEINGQYRDSFTAQINEGNVIVELRDTSVLPIDTTHVVLELRVPGASSVLILDVIDPDISDNTNVYFDELYYTGIWRSEDMSHERIFLSGYNGTSIIITGQYGDSFTAQINEGNVILELRETSVLPIDKTHVVLELHVPGASCVLILDVIDPDISDNTNVYFDELYYTGIWRSEDMTHERIFVSGYNGTTIEINGQYGDSFTAQINEGYVIIELRDTSVLPRDTFHVVLELRVPGAGSVLILNVIDPDITIVSFDELYYTGIWRSEDMSHERIFVLGYEGTTIEISGQYSDSFTAQINEGNVIVELKNTSVLPIDTSHAIIELRVPGAGSVLILEIIDPENPDLPTVRFSSEFYVMQVDKSQIGLIGRVSATASNGENIVYSLLIGQDEFKDLLSINADGQVHLSAPVPAPNGIYTFQVLATTELSLAENNAAVLLVVDGADFCSNERALSPLIILNRDEESPHDDLVILNRTIHENCYYSIINHWPVDQSWLYVDENGLHTSAIDREHESIAFMALSQIQVELMLHCDTHTNDTTRIRRSLNPYVTDTTSLGPYDYGASKWVLTDSIPYNSRRSFVNLIVNDINDNDPIFTLKEHEPIAVGYPLPELVDAVSPQALVELEATDADIGENAALLYWTSEPILAVSPTTGFVHVRSNARLENGASFTIHATDRNGAGRTGSIDIVVRLLNVNSIAVITVRDAFLEDIQTVLTNLSNALGYEVKTLRSVIVPDNSNATEVVRRQKRETNDGALLQLYIYGLIDREPVEVTRLTNDINNNVNIANVATTLSLRDYLENREIRVTEQNTALLATTITFSILLFILIVAFVGWQYLKWRKKRNYDKFSDVNSLASREQIPQPPKTDDVNRPRLNLEELKRSEKRLQDILDAPVNSNNANEFRPQNDVPTETIVNLSPEQKMPIVIQSIDKLKDASEVTDDDDEFGETKSPRRKSVVTFNENVEKIIHVDESSQSEGEGDGVYRL